MYNYITNSKILPWVFRLGAAQALGYHDRRHDSRGLEQPQEEIPMFIF